MYKRKKKALALFFSLMFVFLLLPINARALSPAVKSIDISVNLNDDGSAEITEVWDVTVASGTEWYTIQGNLGDIVISDLSVSDETGLVYETLQNWDTSGDIDDKAGKAGILNTGDGFELCWGVGSYGDHVFTISYTMTNIVKSLNDRDAFNNRFINDDLTSPPQRISVSIAKEGFIFTPDNTNVWAFGFPGEIWVTDGKIVATSLEALSSSSYVGILVSFEKGIFSPLSVQNRNFSEMEEEAKVGSDYYPDDENEEENWNDSGGNWISNFMPIFISVIPAFFVVVFGFIFAVANKENRAKKKYYKESLGFDIANVAKMAKDVNYSREIPFNQHLAAAYTALSEFKLKPSDGDILGAYILRWIDSGRASVMQTEEKGVFSSKTASSIVFLENNQPMETAENTAFSMLRRAAGADGILQEKELQKWAAKNVSSIDALSKSIKFNGEEQLRKTGDAISYQIDSSSAQTATVLTKNGLDNTFKLLGFKKYLKEFTIINERRPAEVELWKEYLVFANLFGIADEVYKEFYALYPDFFNVNTQTGGGYYSNYFMTMHMVNSLTRSYNSGISSARSASSGGGGFSSSGGGGGFSGGGSGGGSR